MHPLRQMKSCLISPAVWISLPVFLILPLAMGSFGITFITQVIIFAVFAMSLDLLIGYTGLMSFNHATFFGVGAYTVAILSKSAVNFWAALFAGICVPMLLAALLGMIVLRSSGPYFLLITLAFNQMVFAAAWKWRSLTGGDDGLSGIPRPDPGLHISMWNQDYFYYLVLIIALFAVFITWKLVKSSFGRSLIGIRESESRMQALGYNTRLIKWLIYIIAAGLAGLAGILYVYFNGFISPLELNWTMSGLVILMVIIGGPGTLGGPIIGAAIILFLQQMISSYTEHWPLVMGIIFVLCVLYTNEGVWGLLRKFSKKVRTSYEGTGGH